MRWMDARRYAMGIAVFSLLVVLGPPTNSAAQSQAGTGQIVGTVYDSTGALVPQAKVTVNNKATGLTRRDAANEEGQYRFVLLPIGFYTITFTHPGFKTYKAEVEVTVGAAVTVNGTLAPGEVSQVVEVTATALIESTQAQPDSLIGVRSIEELPIAGRRFHDFVSLTPNVQIESQRSGISFVGQRGINGNVTIDGADYNEPFFGGIRGGERAGLAFTIPQEAISQFQAVSSGYSVEFGRSSGGILNATTKSGTNEVHGSAFFFARNGDLAANDAFNNPVISSLYQAGGSLGGQIKRDKIFYFTAFEWQKNDIPRVVNFNLGTTAPNPVSTEAFSFFKGLETPFAATNDALTGLGRMDFQLNPNHRATLRYHYSQNTANNGVQTGNVLPAISNRALSDDGTEEDRTNTVTGQWTAIWSPRLVMETRGQYSLENRPRTPNVIQPSIGTSIGTTGTRNFLPTTLDDYRVQIANNLTWTQVKHAIKFGGEVNYIHANQFFKFNQFGVYNLFSSTATTLQFLSDNHLSGGNNRFDTSAATYSINIGDGLLDTSLKQLAFFIQDTWRLTARFTVTAGFRWEAYFNPQPDISNTGLYNEVKNFPFPVGKTADPAFIPDNLRQFMPRLGIAWDPRGDAKTVIRADAGFFYAPTPLLLYAGALNNFRAIPGDLSTTIPFNLSTFPAGTPCRNANGTTTLYCQLNLINVNLNRPATTLTTLPTITPTQIAQLAQFYKSVPGAPPTFSGGLFTGAAPFAIANNYESPRSWQWGVGFERELTRGLSVGADFTYLNTVHLQRNFDLNLPAPVVCLTATTPGCTSADLSLRPCFGVAGGSACNGRDRPIGNNATIPLTNITLRESSARSLYRGVTFRSNYRRGRVQFHTYYTVSKNTSSDDNERTATGYNYDNAFNLSPEYNYSNIDARHLFVANGLVDLPLGFTVSALGRFRSGRPVDPVIGFVANGAEAGFNSNGDRAFSAPGVPFLRNSFRDRATQDVDIRVAKKFRLPREGMSLDFTADFFNIFNFKNIVFTGGNDGVSGNNRQYGLGVNSAGRVIPANARFLRLTDPSFCTSNSGCYDTNAFPGANGAIPPFTVQLGVRFQF